MLVAMLVTLLLILPAICAIDSDKDGIPDDKDEYIFDFDNDGIPDEWEVRHGLRYDFQDGKEDNDHDGLSNLEEYIKGTDPNSVDSDGDNVEDFVEINKLGTDPLRKNRVMWPLVVIPILIIFFVVVIFIIEKFRLDEKLAKYFTKPDIKQSAKTENRKSYEDLMKQTPEQQKLNVPSKNLGQIYKERLEKKKGKQKLIKTFGNDKDGSGR